METGNIGIGNICTMATFNSCAVTKMDALFIPSIIQRVEGRISTCRTK